MNNQETQKQNEQPETRPVENIVICGDDVIEHSGKRYVPERRLLLAVKAGEQRWSRIQTLRWALQDIKAFSVAHHSDQAGHVLLHGLTVDIPAMIDDALSK